MDVENYLELLSFKNSQRTRFYDLSEAVLSIQAANGTAAESFDYIFDIENAAGHQLDIIGLLVGIPRLLNYLPASGDRVMDDDEYRMAILLTIAKNSWDGGLASIRTAYESIFGNEVSIVYLDNQNMTVAVTVYGGLTTRELEIMENSGTLLIPAGVGKTVSIVGGEVETNLSTAVGISALIHEDHVDEKEYIAGGPIASFETNVVLPLLVTSTITPVQDLSGGDPYPPGGGKNLLDDSGLLRGFYNTTGAYTSNGNYISYKMNLPAGTYTFSTDLENCFIPRYLIDDVQTPASVTTQKITFTLNADGEFKITIRNSSTSDISAITPHSQIESGSTATPYSPYSHICPITGWTGAEVNGTGKNLFNPSSANYKTGYYLYTNDTEQANAKYKYTQGYFHVKPSTTYAVSYTKEFADAVGCYANLYDANKRYLTRITISGISGTGRVSGTFTTTADTVYARFSMPYRASDGGETDIQLEENSTASTYEAFGTNLTVDWEDEAGTVYGGSLKVNTDGTGVLTAKYGKKTFTGANDETWISAETGGIYRYYTRVNDCIYNSSRHELISNMGVYASSGNPVGAIYLSSFSSDGATGARFYYVPPQTLTSVSDFKTWLSTNNLEIVYELATPVTYTLTAQQVGQLMSLNGLNNVWANTGDVSVAYKKA